MFKVLTVAVLSVYLVQFFYGNSALTLTINQGVIKGKTDETCMGRTFFSFTGIPYAQPPLGELRFKAPVPVLSWNGVYDATENHDVCPQINIYAKDFPIIGNEDCLFLNVYTPQLPNSESSLLPVLFYIHGGAFIMGSARSDWISPEILLEKDIILVTANYRLGAFGLLSTGDEVAPGNTGLKDQNLALKWVKENIAHFGGDPKRITVSGNSAGAVSAHYHLISPLSKDLLSGAIIQSGSALMFYALATKDEAVKNAKKLGSLLNCPTDSNVKLIECLRTVKTNDFIKLDSKFAAWDNDTTLPFKPVIESNIEDAFLVEDPMRTIKSGKAADVPIMTGIVEEEGAFKSAGISESQKELDFLNKHFNMIVSESFGITSDVNKSGEAMKRFYFGERLIDGTMKTELTNMYTDGWFLWGLENTVQLHFEHSSSKIYKYLFGYRGSATYTSHFSRTNHDYGTCHTDELFYLFKLNLTFPNYIPTENDNKMKELMTTLWTNFISTGNPTPEGNTATIPTKWHPVSTNQQEYYHIKSYNDVKMSKNLFPSRTAFWMSLPIRKEEITN